MLDPNILFDLITTLKSLQYAAGSVWTDGKPKVSNFDGHLLFTLNLFQQYVPGFEIPTIANEVPMHNAF